MTTEEEIQRINEEMVQWAREISARYREEDAKVPAPQEPKIESSFATFPAHSFRREETQKTPVMLITESCPTVSFQCDSISASKTKCGFLEFGTPSSPPKLYLQIVDEIEGSYSATLLHDFGGGFTCGSTETDTYSGYKTTTTYDPDSDCASTSILYEGTLSTHIDSHTGATTCTFDRTVNNGGSATESGSVCGCSSSPSGCAVVTTSAFVTSGTTSRSREQSYQPPNPTCVSYGWSVSGSATNTQTLSSEYSTALLVSKTGDALPAYGGLFSSLCLGATRQLSTDETSYSIRRFKARFTFSVAAPAMLHLRYTEQFIPTLTADVTYMGTLYHAGSPDPDPAHWTNTSRTWTAVGGETFHDVEILEPTSNGTTTIVNVVTDCSDVPDHRKITYGEV